MKRIPDLKTLVENLSFSDEMPPLGRAIAEYAETAGYEMPEILAAQLMMRPGDIPLKNKEGTLLGEIRFIPGQTIGGEWGPVLDADVMVIGRMPSLTEIEEGALCHGGAFYVFKEHLDALGADYENWYFTNVVRFYPPGSSKNLKAEWIKECRWMLQQELEMVKPKHILLLGKDAVKVLMGKSATLNKLRGVDTLEYRGAKVTVTTHPGALLRDPTQSDAFRDDLEKFVAGVQKRDLSTAEPVKHFMIDRAADLEALVSLWIEEGHEWFSLDAEWGGTGKSDWANGFLRSIQLAVRTHESYFIKVRGVGLESNPFLTEQDMLNQLSRLLCRPTARLVGHNLRADLKWFLRLGAHIEQAYDRGFDTATAFHLLHPSQGKDMALESLSVKYTDRGRYDWELRVWCEKNGLNKEQIAKYGYANVPDEVLFPYACFDVDIPLRVMPILKKELHEMEFKQYGAYTHNGNRVATMWDFYEHIIHPTSLPLLEVEMTGLLADQPRLRDLVYLFRDRQAEMAKKFQEHIGWPDFNFRSINHMREFLFGFRDTQALINRLAGKPYRQDRPADAMCLNLTPVKTTGKPSMDWKSVGPDMLLFVNPGTDSESLQILGAKAPEAAMLAELRFVDQVVKNFLRAPDKKVEAEKKEQLETVVVKDPYEEEDGGEDSQMELLIVKAMADDEEIQGELVEDEDGEEVYTTGLVGEVDPDGYVHTNISQFTETGRYRSSSPNLQNLPKRQEAKLKRIFCPDVKRLDGIKGWDGWSVQKLKDEGLLHKRYHTIRSCFVAPPGYVLIEADYSQAELCVLAGLSGDKNLMSAMVDPDRDLHSEIAVAGLRLPCDPHEVKKLFPTRRDAAKSVVYGTLYGRGPAAVVREMQKFGIMDFEVDDARGLQDALFGQCPDVYAYIEASHKLVYSPGFVENPFGRRRYFPDTSDEGTRAEQERQAVNAPIQGTVAEVLSIALTNLYRMRADLQMQDSFRITVPIHDAVMLYAKAEEAPFISNDLLPVCMRDLARIPILDMTLDIDVDVTTRWSVKMKLEEAMKYALDAVSTNVA